MGVAECGAILNIIAWTDEFEFMDETVENKDHVIIQTCIFSRAGIWTILFPSLETILLDTDTNSRSYNLELLAPQNQAFTRTRYHCDSTLCKHLQLTNTVYFMGK